MSYNLIDLTGKKFGRLTVIKRSSCNKRGNCMWECLCSCGKSKLIESVSLRRGHTESCGCIWQKNDQEYMEHLKKRLLDNHQKVGDCWIWTKALNISGYGITKIRTKRILTHRASYLLWKGEIPKGFFVLHSCDVRSCINPDHLWTGNSLDNVRDMIAKNRHNFFDLKNTA